MQSFRNLYLFKKDGQPPKRPTKQPVIVDDLLILKIKALTNQIEIRLYFEINVLNQYYECKRIDMIVNEYRVDSKRPLKAA